ncbi:hypothetical protein AB685_09845 [Bacillus sp. LL01]|uniref:DUF3231 family protein n=1 Tax=Bacillus sp. LL01 TaxID=1665556 RepID=UPI00064D6591|nr:DUF3231 family protein [Bacillus sp. LL01]KMJ58208.1 hypothetical protein AB685_09845 [Bacillus sp. LL01]
MENTHEHIRLTSAEIGHLWSSYLFETSVHHMFSYFLMHVDDPDNAEYVEYCLQVSKRHVQDYIKIFKKENFPVPRGITSEDINPKAPRLFSDVFYLHYIDGMAKFALNGFSLAVSEVSRKDVREVFHLHLDALQKVTEMGKRLLLAKGIHSRPPYISTPETIEFVKNGHFFAGLTDEKRPLTVIEMNQLFQNVRSNALGKALLKGFMQVTDDKKLCAYFEKGKLLANKYVTVFSTILLKEDCNVPSTYGSEVMDATVAPFSNRFMLNHVTHLISYGTASYGLSMALSPRKDLALMYIKIMGEVMTFAAGGAKLMVKHGWLEQPPTKVNHKLCEE